MVHAGSPQTRQRIAGLFWPDSTDAQALTNLRRELHYLRQVLGDEPSLVVMPRDLCWRETPTCRVDVRTFEIEREAALAACDDEGILAHATEAIGEYRGDFLPGGYDDWLLETRAALERRCVDLCDLVCEIRPALPEELSGWIGLITIPPAAPFPEELWGRKSCAIVWCYAGPHERAGQSLG